MIMVSLTYMEGWRDVRSVDDVMAIKQISRIDGLPYFLNFGAPRARGASLIFFVELCF